MDNSYVLEKPALLPMPAHLPPVYQAFTRIVNVEGYVHLDTNRYSVPERLIEKSVEVYKYPVDVKVLFRHREVAEHPRFVGKRHKQKPSRRIIEPDDARSISSLVRKSDSCAESRNY